jgi:2-hydroxychromene-2-carboxylate isomerase
MAGELGNNMTRTLDFFLFYGSIHTYLSVMRMEALAAPAEVAIRWRPFNLRSILIEQNNTAFARNPVRLAYNWRDIQRRSGHMGIPFAGPAPYPADPDLLALRVGTIAAAEGWCAAYTTATFSAWFLDKRTAGTAENVAHVLTQLGQPADAIMARAASAETSERLAAETNAARALGIFGSPTFAAGGEIFWGDDRLEDAVAFAATSGWRRSE